MCGSIEHPSLAKLTSENITQEVVDKARIEAEKVQKTCNELLQMAAKTKAEVEADEKNILDIARKEFKILTILKLKEELPNILNSNTANSKLLNTQLAKLNTNLIEKKRLTLLIENFEKTEETSKKNISDLENENINRKEVINNFTAQINEMKKTLEFNSEIEAQHKLNEFKNIQKELKEKLQSLEKIYNEALTSYNQMLGQKKELENNLKDKEFVDVEKLNVEKIKLDDDIKELDNEKTKVFSRHQTNTTALKNLNRAKKELETSSVKRNVLQNLSDTANGCLDNKLKLTFENFVLSRYFKQILVAANRRFKAITYNQFEFKHSEDSKGNAYIGLDINVFDSYTGKERPVSTLSGGESFKAALSLALGLSDIIQQQVGGVQIDTMFIDEGFGSLDSDSLDQTMKILMELSNNETLIGIISHVAELREKIDRKIIVSKDKRGSSIKVEIP